MATFDEILDQAALRNVGFHGCVDQIPEGRRFHSWHDILCETFYDFDMSSPKPDFSVGQIVVKDVGEVRAGIVRSDPITVERARCHLSRGSGDFMYVSMPLNSSICMEQRGALAEVAAGDMAFVVTSDSYRYIQSERLDQLTLRLPAQLMRERFPGVEDLSATHLSRRHAPVNLFLDYASSFCVHAGELDADASAIAGNTLLDLLAFALTSRRSSDTSSETSVKIAHLRRAIRHIEAHLDDPALAVASIARAVNVSERYLQRLFAERDQTVTSFIRNRRVSEAKRLLRDPASRSQTIASIAFRVGFTDPSHFSRLFRETTGISPRDYRDGG